MAEIWKPLAIEVYKSWAEALEAEASDSLNEWELDFLISISAQLDKDRQLSQKQAEVLERIYAEKTS